MAEYNQLYQQALYYDIALSRDVSREIDFIQQAYHYYTGFELHSVLEIACGPGYHTRALAQRGLRTIGLDLRPEMLAFAREQAKHIKVDPAWIVADMRSFQLIESVDMAICMFDGIDPLLTDDDLLQHLQTIASNLNSAGLYLIHYSHPRYCSLQNYGSFNYKGERDNISVEIKWATNNPKFDPITAVAEVETELRVNDNGKMLIIRDKAQERLVTAQDLSHLVQLSQVFQIVGWHGDFDINQPLDNSSASQHMICILKKRERSIMDSQATSYLSPKLVAKPDAHRGYGVFAQKMVKKGELLAVWGGEVVTVERLAEFDRLQQQRSIQVEENLYLVATHIGPADYVNHSCEPNAGMSGQISLVALRDIQPSEEVCYDYAMSDGSPYDEFECHCQSPYCRHQITGNDWQNPELWSKYDCYFSPYLQRRIHQMQTQLNLTTWSVGNS